VKCPKCNVNLLITERQGVEVDYCPECRGVWLDRGELDKIIERSTLVAARDGIERYDGHDDHGRNDHGRGQEHRGPDGRKRGWLSALFD
jgi:Zn-finger nucleic acid-binding protein